MIQGSKIFLLTISATAVISLGACTPTLAKRGNLLEDYQVAEIQQGVSSRSDVLRNLGSPTTKSTFDPNVWYYIGQETEKRGILDPEVINERIIVVAFNEEGIVEIIRDVDNQRMDVPFMRDKTPTHGNEVTLMQQFFGNLGRFNPPTDQGNPAQ
jgi:outer membrane protein assembly factor BamE (lipoprotein component of BamABCDE complex)